MKRNAQLIAAVCMAACAGVSAGGDDCDVIARDSLGLVVELKEKYGAAILDSCTVVMRCGDEYITVHRSGPSGHYPVANWSLPVRKDE